MSEEKGIKEVAKAFESLPKKKNIYQKLLEVKKEIGTITKDKKNPFFKSNYADINTIIEQVEPLLIEHGLVLTQALGVDADNGTILSCASSKITCVDTQDYIISEILLPNQSDPQKMGSAITYYRRYTLVSLLGLMTEDDDGNKASGKEDKKEPIKIVKKEDRKEAPFKDARPVLNEVNDNWSVIVTNITKADKAEGEVILGKVKAKYQMDKNTLATLQKLVK